MANIYCASTGSNTAPYDTWAKAATALLTAVDAAAAGDTIYAHQETETISADTVYVLPNNAKLICSNDTTNAPPQTLGTRTIDGSGTAGVDISIRSDSASAVYVRGLYLKSGGSSTTAAINISNGNQTSIVLESCTFEVGNTNINSRVAIGNSGTISEISVITRSCSFIWAASGQGISIQGPWWQSYGDDFVAGATTPSTLFATVSGAVVVHVEGGDLSDVTGNIFAVPAGTLIADLVNSKIGSGVTVAPTWNHPGEGEITLRNCNSGDSHYSLAHYNYLGSTVISTSIYTGTASTDYGTSLSWVVASSANSTFYKPYVSPWIDVYHDGTSAITPSVEVVRDGSATAYQDDEIWAEWSYQGTTGSTRASFVNDRMAILGTAANQATGALGASDWTGEGGTAWFGKLTPTSTITPAEIGHLRVRIYVGEASTTVYVDPQHRTLS